MWKTRSILKDQTPTQVGTEENLPLPPPPLAQVATVGKCSRNMGGSHCAFMIFAEDIYTHLGTRAEVGVWCIESFSDAEVRARAVAVTAMSYPNRIDGDNPHGELLRYAKEAKDAFINFQKTVTSPYRPPTEVRFYREIMRLFNPWQLAKLDLGSQNRILEHTVPDLMQKVGGSGSELISRWSGMRFASLVNLLMQFLKSAQNATTPVDQELLLRVEEEWKMLTRAPFDTPSAKAMKGKFEEVHQDLQKHHQQRSSSPNHVMAQDHAMALSDELETDVLWTKFHTLWFVLFVYAKFFEDSYGQESHEPTTLNDKKSVQQSRYFHMMMFVECYKEVEKTEEKINLSPEDEMIIAESWDGVVAAVRYDKDDLIDFFFANADDPRSHTLGEESDVEFQSWVNALSDAAN